MPVRNITKPECDCSVDFEDYDAYRIDYCPLHARATAMRELLREALKEQDMRYAASMHIPSSRNNERWMEPAGSPPEWVVKARALLEATHA